MRYLSGQYLLGPAGPGFHFVWPAALFFVLMAMIGTTYCYVVSQTNNKRAPITRMSQRVQTIGWTLAVAGLVVIGIRWGGAHIAFLDRRLVLYLLAFGFLALIGWTAWWMLVVLPQKNAAYEERLLRRQYQPRARRRR